MTIAVRRLLMNAVLVIVSLAISMKLADLAIGAVLDIDSQSRPTRHITLREPAPNYERVMRPATGTLASSDGMEAKSVRYRVDADGFIIGSETTAAGDDGGVDMVFVGGSTTECAYVTEELRFPALVSRLVDRASGEAVRTLNAGYSGNNSMHSAFVILGKVLPYKPRLVFVMEAINDLSQLNTSGSYWSGPQSRALVEYSNVRSISSVASVAVAAKDWLIPNAWQLMKPYVGQWFLPALVDEFADYRGQQVDTVPFDLASSQFSSALRTIVRTVKAWGSEPVLMTQFNRLQPDDEFVMTHSGMTREQYGTFITRYGAFNEIVRTVAREEGAFLIDLDREVPHSRTYIIDSVHLNDAGSQLVAGVIARQVAARFPEYVLRSSTQEGP